MSNQSLIAAAPLPANDIAASALQDQVKRVMEALTRLLVGKQGDARGPAFNREMIVVVGAPLSRSGMLWLADMARLNRRHALHFGLRSDSEIPSIVLAYRRGDSIEVYENCMLCMQPGDERVSIVPDSFQHGSFQLSSGMKLRRRRAPHSFEAATELMICAYNRLHDALAVDPVDDWKPIKVKTG